MIVHRFIGPALAGAAFGLVASTLAIVSYDCIRHWYIAGNGNPLCVYDFQHYVFVYDREPGGAMRVSCLFDPNFPNDVTGAAP